MKKLSIGAMLSPFGGVRVEDVRPYARHVEELGLDAVFVADHLASVRPMLDSTITLATVAAVTERVRIGFAVMVLPLRHPAWIAKQVSTLQLLSGNRLVLGVGVGGAAHGTAAWEAVGVPYAERGRRTDIALAVLPGLIAGDPTALGPGRLLTLAPAAEVPPIWVGGGSTAALRRAVEHGTAWFPSMVLADSLARGARRLEELAAERGRRRPDVAAGGAVLLGSEASSPALERFTGMLAGGYGIPPAQAAAVPITGEPARAAERFAEYAEAGATSLVLNVIAGDWRRQVELIAQARALMA